MIDDGGYRAEYSTMMDDRYQTVNCQLAIGNWQWIIAVTVTVTANCNLHTIQNHPHSMPCRVDINSDTEQALGSGLLSNLSNLPSPAPDSALQIISPELPSFP